MKPQKKSLYYKICEKTVLAPEFRDDNQYLTGVSDLELHFSGTESVTFFGAQSSLGGHKEWFGGHGPWLPPVESSLLQVYCNLSNCNYCIFVKEILLEIGFIEEMRPIWGTPNLFYNFRLFAKIRCNSFDSVQLSTLHLQFRDITKGKNLQKFLQTKKRDYQQVAVSSLAITKSENLAIVTGICKPKLPVLIYRTPFVMSQNCEKQGC